MLLEMIRRWLAFGIALGGAAPAFAAAAIAGCSSFEGSEAQQPEEISEAGAAADVPDGGHADALVTAPRHLWIFGGNDYHYDGSFPFVPGTYRAPLEADGGLGGWEAVPELAVGRANAGYVADKQGVVIATGGVVDVQGQRSSPVASVETVSLGAAAPSWRPAPPLPEPRAAHATALLDDTVYVAAGANDGWSAVSSIFAATYSPGEGGLAPWTMIGNAPEPVSDAAMAAVGDRVYLAGGSTDTVGVFSSGVWGATRLADGMLGPWADAGAIPLRPFTHLSGHRMVTVGDRVVVLGGTSASNTGIVDAFVGAIAVDGTIKWKATTPMPFEARLPCVAVDGDVVYVLGGRPAESIARVMRGRVEVNGAIAWTEVSPLPEARDSFGCAVQ